MAGTPINPLTFFGLVRARLIADSTLTAIVPSNSVMMAAGPEDYQVTPAAPIRIVYAGSMTLSDTGLDGTTFTSQGLEATLQVRVQWYREGGSSSAATVMDRIMGDYDPSTQTAPSFGLNIWAPTLSGWTFQPYQIQEMFAEAITDAVMEGTITLTCTGQMD